MKIDLLEIIQKCLRDGTCRGHIDIKQDRQTDIGVDFVLYPQNYVAENSKEIIVPKILVEDIQTYEENNEESEVEE